MDKLLQMQETLLKDNRQWTSVKDKHVESMKVKINFVLAFPSFMNVPILFKYLKKKTFLSAKISSVNRLKNVLPILSFSYP
jgi:hypothetical protein